MKNYVESKKRDKRKLKKRQGKNKRKISPKCESVYIRRIKEKINFFVRK